MERKFNPDNFESFLRGQADQFKMSPSKKVWHGIYNDLHPGRRWPSIAMSMLFVFTLVIVGHLNTNNGRTTVLNDITTPASLTEKTTSANTEQKSSAVNLGNSSPNRLIKQIESDNSTSSTPDNIIVNNDQALAAIPTSNLKRINISATQSITNDSPENSIIIPGDVSTNNIAEVINETDDLSNNTAENLNISEESKKDFITDETADETNVLNTLKAKRKNNVSWSYYFTPSLGYRFFSDENINSSVMHQAMFGHEAGTAMNIKLFKNVELTSGLQLNYSGYSIKANNTHPVIASLQLNEPGGVYSVYSTMSHYGNSATNDFTKLKNYSFQASVPIGLAYKFAETENIKFGAAASLQPTFIIASQPYLLSTDKRNYLTNSDVIRNWNMNTSLSTYISFDHNSLNWQIGPQVRYQLLSTYNKRYPLTENLVNYGIRVGISKSK